MLWTLASAVQVAVLVLWAAPVPAASLPCLPLACFSLSCRLLANHLASCCSTSLCITGGEGIDTDKHAATLTLGRPGVLHGSYSLLIQDEEGQVVDPHSISAG